MTFLNSQNKEDTILITQTRNEIMNQFEILKSQGFDAYKKYVDSKKEEQKKTLTKREYYEWLHAVNENLKNIPYTTEVIHHYDLATAPDEIKEAISYASDIGALVKVKQAGLITEEQFKNIRKRIQKSHKISTDIVI